MKSIIDLSKDEREYICKHIWIPLARMYFQKNPRKLAEVRSGFSPQKMSDSLILSVLINNTNKPFISTFLDNEISEWFKQIEENISKLEGDGYSKGEALLKTFPESHFGDNIPLYYKLINEEKDDDYISLICDALSLIGKIEEQYDKEKSIIDDNHESEASKLDEATKKIKELEAQVDSLLKEKSILQQSLNKTENDLKDLQEVHKDTSSQLNLTNETLTQMKAELEHYRYLDSYSDDDYVEDDLKGYQYLSLGQIVHDYNGKTRIARLADIIDGELREFKVDDTQPPIFGNRSLLYYYNGPQNDGALGIWYWRADVHDKDPARDHIKSDFNYDAKFIEIIDLPQCASLSDISSYITKKFVKCFVGKKVFFGFSVSGNIKEGLLCSEDQFEYVGEYARIKPSVMMLPQYRIAISDIVSLVGRQFYSKMNLGMPHALFRVQEPYDAVKSILLSRVTIPLFRDQGLTQKEAQHCKAYLQNIPTNTIIQVLSDAYGCSDEEAQEYIEGFIAHCDSYLSSNDIDTNALSRIVSRNSELKELCKKELTVEWKSENKRLFDDEQKRLESVEENLGKLKEETDNLNKKKDFLNSELLEIDERIAEREKFAKEVEKGISERIQKARMDAAEFISQMAFAAPVSTSGNTIEVSKSNNSSVFVSTIDHTLDGTIDDLNTFEEELAENFMNIGYDEVSSLNMSQVIGFSICRNLPIIIGENPVNIAKCLATTIEGGSLTEFFVSGFDSEYSLIDNTIQNRDRSDYLVCLFHGLLDNYSNRLYNFIVNRINTWGDKLIVLLSMQGIQPSMMPSNIWNHAFYIDGDTGLINTPETNLNSFKIDFNFRADTDNKEYKEKKKQLNCFSSVLTNTQISLYSSYLSYYGIDISESNVIISQIINANHSSGNEEALKNIFHENGITLGENALV